MNQELSYFFKKICDQKDTEKEFNHFFMENFWELLA